MAAMSTPPPHLLLHRHGHDVERDDVHEVLDVRVALALLGVGIGVEADPAHVLSCAAQGAVGWAAGDVLDAIDYRLEGRSEGRRRVEGKQVRAHQNVRLFPPNGTYRLSL